MTDWQVYHMGQWIWQDVQSTFEIDKDKYRAANHMWAEITYVQQPW